MWVAVWVAVWVSHRNGGERNSTTTANREKSKAPLDAVRGLVAVCRREIARFCFGMRESQSRPQLDRLEDRASRGRQLEGSGSSKGIEGLGEDELRLVLQGLGCAAVASTWTSSPPGKVADFHEFSVIYKAQC